MVYAIGHTIIALCKVNHTIYVCPHKFTTNNVDLISAWHVNIHRSDLVISWREFGTKMDVVDLFLNT